MSLPRLILALLTLLVASCAAAAEGLPVLRTVGEVRELTNANAAKGYPVHVQGVITLSEGDGGLHFIADATGGIYVHLAGKRTPRGKLVEIRGRSQPGLTVPYIDVTASEGSLSVQGEAPMPTPIKVEPDQLHDIAYDAQLVEVRGTVQKVGFMARRAVVELSVGAPQVHLQLVGFSSRSTLPQYLQDFTVSAIGILGPRPLAGGPQMLFVASLRDVKVDPQELEERFSSAQPVSETGYDTKRVDSARRQRAFGQVVYVEPGLGFFLSHAKSGPWKPSLWVYAAQASDVGFGQHVEVVGDLDADKPELSMHNALVRPLNSVDDGPPPVSYPTFDPFDINSRAAANGKLITIDLPLLSHQRSVTGEDNLVLARSDGWILARVKADPAQTWQPVAGSLLRLTGVCVTKEADVFGVDAEAVRGQLLIRSSSDIQTLKKPPFWTDGRLRWLLWSALGVSVFAFAWVVTLRRRVRRQMAMIGHQLERQAIHEERARLAREWHDTLQQQLVGVSIQVQAAAAHCGQAPELVPEMLERADAMLRHSQAEARRSVWNLRNEILEQRGLAEALKELRFNEPGGPTVTVRSNGDARRRLPAETEFHLLRIAQEAVANALQHASAHTVELVLQAEPETVTLSVKDDGRGFDPAKAGAANGTHFGLLGMKERAAKIAAQLSIETSTGQGTTISVTVKNQSFPPQAPLAQR